VGIHRSVFVHKYCNVVVWLAPWQCKGIIVPSNLNNYNNNIRIYTLASPIANRDNHDLAQHAMLANNGLLRVHLGVRWHIVWRPHHCTLACFVIRAVCGTALSRAEGVTWAKFIIEATCYHFGLPHKYIYCSNAGDLYA